MTKVLIVDDSKLVRVKCRKILEQYDYEVMEAADGEEGLAVIGKEIPDVVILDVVMPNLSGYEVLDKIKSSEKLKGIPVIMLTVKAEKEDIVNGLNRGADEYVTKPFQEQELIARVNAMVRIRELYNQLLDKNKILEETNHHLSVAKEKIEEQEKVVLLGQFMVGIQHELRNPLAAAMANAQILLKYFNFTEEPGYFLNDTQDQLVKMTTILNDVKDMDTVELEDYARGIKMVKLSRKQDQ